MNIKKSSDSYQFKYNDEKLNNIEFEIQTFKNSDFTSLNLNNNTDLIPGKYEGMNFYCRWHQDLGVFS